MFIFYFLSAAFATSLIGITDLLEFCFFNPEVFRRHNFPDVVPDLKPGRFAAFWSGVRASYWLFFVSRGMQYVVGIPVHSPIWDICAVLWVIFLMCFDKLRDKTPNDIYKYHKHLYVVCFVAEFAWIVVEMIIASLDGFLSLVSVVLRKIA